MIHVEKFKYVRYVYSHQQISNGHVGDEPVGWAVHVVYRTNDVNHHSVSDQRKDNSQYCKYSDPDLNV